MEEHGHPYRQEPLVRIEYKMPPLARVCVYTLAFLLCAAVFVIVGLAQRGDDLKRSDSVPITGPKGDWLVFSTRDTEGKSELHFRGPNGNEVIMNDEVRAHVDPCSMNDVANPCYHANHPVAEMNNGGDLGFFSYWESTSPHSIWLNGDTQTWSAAPCDITCSVTDHYVDGGVSCAKPATVLTTLAGKLEWEPLVDAGACK